MEQKENSSLITDRMNSLPKIYPGLAGWPSSKLFSALCLKDIFYQSAPSDLKESEILEDVIDGSRDGGVDILFSDPEEKADGDYYICQSKYYSEKITYDELIDAIHKLVDFYNNLKAGKHGSEIREDVCSKATILADNLSDEGTVHFVFLTSASMKDNDRKKAINSFEKFKPTAIRSDLIIYDQEGIKKAISEAELKKPYVEADELHIDETNNVLYFSEDPDSEYYDAAVCNISAFSLKHLYEKYGNALLAQNLRYYVRKRDVDNAIDKTIEEDPQDFWYKNNGVTILCDSFEFSGNLLKPKDFSIINGGQTTYKIGNNPNVNDSQDLYLTCKVIRNKPEDDSFALNIAQATNSQKPIKKSDLKANAPEQQHFYQSLITNNVYYQMKRGDKAPKTYPENYQKTKLDEVLKLALAAVYQLPGTSRNQPSKGFEDAYYNPLFIQKSKTTGKENQLPFAKITAQALYLQDAYNRFSKKYKDPLNQSFANNSRTACVAFVSFLSRIHQDPDLKGVASHIYSECFQKGFSEDLYRSEFYPELATFDHFDHIFNDEFYSRKDDLDNILFQLFTDLIKQGNKQFLNMNRIAMKGGNTTQNETNFLKKNENYYMFAYDSDLLDQSLEIADKIF